MTFLERYSRETTWHGRAMIMEIYHLTMTARNKAWTVTQTAKHFNCSIGLASENLKLAHAFHSHPDIIKSPTRQEALKKLNGT